jgi:hypothetical protein
MISIKKFIRWYWELYWKLVNEFDNYWINKIYFISKNIILVWSSIIKFNDNWNIIWYLKKFDLTHTLEKTISKIYSFYKVLNWTENINDILYWVVKAEEWYEHYNWTYLPVDLYWGQDMWDYFIQNSFPSYIEKNEKILSNWIIFWYSNYQDEYADLPIPQAKNENPEKYSFYEESDIYDDIREEILTFKEFYLLMQIYFWLYQEHEYKKELEENEKNWKYDKISTTPYFNEEITRDLVEEYLKLQLMQKDTSWAFDWLKIEKIYDKDWSQEKQREHIDEINKEFGEEVIVED